MAKVRFDFNNSNINPSTCEECFIQTLNVTNFTALQIALYNGIISKRLEIQSLAELYDILESDEPRTLVVVLLILSLIIEDGNKLDDLLSCLDGGADDGTDSIG